MSTTLYTPRIQPDETLYSYLARCQQLWGVCNSRLVSKDWFGRASVSINQLLPTEVGNIAKYAHYKPGFLLREHTLFHLFSCYCKRSAELEQVMLGSGGLALGNTATLSHLGLSETGYSNCCPECLADDIKRLGCGYWHLTHQFTGVKVCHIHKCALVRIQTSHRKFELPILPTNSSSEPAPVIQAMFAEHVAKAIAMSKCELNTPFTHNCVVDAFFSKGRYLDIRGLLHFLDAIEVGLQVPKVINEACLRRLIREPHAAVHPFKALLLDFALSFFPEPVRVENSKDETLKGDERTRRCTLLLKKHRFSMRDISRRVGVSVGFVKQLAKRLKIPLDERRQIITPEMERSIKALAIKGADRKEIAQNHGVSVGAVEQIIQSEKGLVIWRQYLRTLTKRNLMRQSLIKAIKKYSNCSRTQLRASMQKEYGFLYKFDKTWLFKTLPSNQKPIYHRGKLWSVKDGELFPQFKRYLRKVLEEQHALPTRYQIDKSFGKHGWFTRSFEKLPRCNRFYRRVLSKFGTTKGEN